MNSNTTLCVGVSFRAINNFECTISRIFGSIIIFISCFSILFNIRFVYWSSYHRQHRSHNNLFIYSMIFSSLLVIAVIIPSVILQCLTCSRVCSSFSCQLEGFISYLNGCVHMFMLMMISIIRYDSVLHANTTGQYFKQHPYLNVAICWLFAFIFALLPLFNWNQYVPEGLGFHCGLNWMDRSLSSRLYLLSAFLFLYIIPLLILFILNTHVYCVIHHLLHRASIITQQPSITLPSANGLPVKKSQSPRSVSLSSSSRSITRSAKFDVMKLSKLIPVNNLLKTHHVGDPVQTHQIMRLKRLKADRRFALAIIFLVSEYLLSWTPYACVVLLHIFHTKFIIERPLLVTMCAFIAKISMIINPFIYVSTIKVNQLKTILFWKQCSCQNCKMNKNIVHIRSLL